MEVATVEGELGWPTDFKSRYKMGKIIGIGFFGRVYIGSELATGRQVAIKVMPKQRGRLTRERTLEKLLLEVESLRQLQSSPNAVRLLGVYEDTEEVQMVTELCAGGDLEQLSEDVGNLPERAVALIAYEVLRMVDACHEAGVVHGDIKPANFMLRTRKENPLGSPNEPRYLAIPWLAGIDFGCAQPVGDERLHLRAGTPTYMAPECLGRDYHIEADLWSVGATLYQLFARRTPEWRTFEECRQHILEHPDVDAPLPLDVMPWPTMSPEGRDLIGRLLSHDWEARITAREALSHPWFAQWVPDFKPVTAASRAPRAKATPGAAAPPPVSTAAALAATTSDVSSSTAAATVGSSAAARPPAASGGNVWPPRRAAGMPGPRVPSTQQPAKPAAPAPAMSAPASAAAAPAAPTAAPVATPSATRPGLPARLGGGVGPPTPYTHKTLPPHMREIDERAPVFKPEPSPPSPDGAPARPRWTVARPGWWKWGANGGAKGADGKAMADGKAK